MGREGAALSDPPSRNATIVKAIAVNAPSLVSVRRVIQTGGAKRRAERINNVTRGA
jgi:hypothetical protein